MLRRTLLAAVSSGRLHQAVITAPQTRAIVDRYVAGDTTADAVRTARALRSSGLLVSLDYLGEDTSDPGRPPRSRPHTWACCGSCPGPGWPGAAGAEVSVKATAVGLFLPEHGEKTATENIARICTAARNAGTTVTLDAEEHTAGRPDAADRGRSCAPTFPTWAAWSSPGCGAAEADCERAGRQRGPGPAVQGRLRRAPGRGLHPAAGRGPVLRPVPQAAACPAPATRCWPRTTRG